MPAFSQSLTFNVNSTSTVVLDYPNTGTTALTYLSDRIKGDGYFSNSDGLHTVFWSVNNFIGTIAVQGTLASEPQESDWATVDFTSPTNRYTVDTTGLFRPAIITATTYTTSTSEIKSYNFTGNFVWLRGKVSDFTQGTVNAIKINK